MYASTHQLLSCVLQNKYQFVNCLFPIYINFNFPCVSCQYIKMTLTLYMIPASPPVRAVLLLAAYLGIALDLKEVDIMKGEQLKPEFLKVMLLYLTSTYRNNNKLCNR